MDPASTDKPALNGVRYDFFNLADLLNWPL